MAEDRDRRSVVDHELEELPHVQVHALQAPDAEPAGPRVERGCQSASTARCSTSRHLDQIGQLQVPTTVAGADAYNAIVQPLINQYGYTVNGVPTGGGYVGYGTEFDQDNFARDQAQVGYNIDVRRRRSATTSTPGSSGTSTRRTCRAAPTGGASSRFPAAGCPAYPRAATRAARRPTTWRSPTSRGSAAWRRSTPSTARSTSRSTTRSTSSNFSVNLGMLMSRDKLYGQGLGEATTLSGCVLSPGEPVPRSTRSRSASTFQPRVGAHLGVQRQGHHLRQLRAIHAGRQFPAARGVVGAQPVGRLRSTRTSTRTASCTAPRSSRHRRASCSCPT